MGFPGGSDSKESACKAGDPGLILGLGRFPGRGLGKPLQYSCLENSMDRGVWWAKVQGVTNSWTQLSFIHSLVLPYTGQRFLLTTDTSVGKQASLKLLCVKLFTTFYCSFTNVIQLIFKWLFYRVSVLKKGQEYDIHSFFILLIIYLFIQLFNDSNNYMVTETQLRTRDCCKCCGC